MATQPVGGQPRASGGSASAYRQAGVDLEAKRPLVQRLAAIARRTHGPAVIEGVGGFGGVFSLAPLLSPSGVFSPGGEGTGRGAPDRPRRPGGLREPVLVAGADGVGTKVKLLAATGRHRTAGVDLVAMSANDVAACGAEPLFFLDYFAASALRPEVVEAVVEGIADACQEAGCALLGGETAEMPDVYAAGEYELAGFCVGVAERERLFGREKVRPGDLLVGFFSSGLHANGFSLVRRVLAQAAVSLESPAPWAPEHTLADELLRPTRLYVKPLRAVASAVEVHAAAHVTGGGLPDNLARVLPAGTVARLERSRWPLPPVFGWLAKVGGIPEEEMFRVFNMGLGMVVAVPSDQAEMAVALARAAGQEAAVVGAVVQAPAGEVPPAARTGPVLWFQPSAKHPEEGGWVEIAP